MGGPALPGGLPDGLDGIPPSRPDMSRPPSRSASSRKPISRRHPGVCPPAFREFDDEPPIYKAKDLPLGVVISRGVDRFVYTYDYGDNWRHDVIVEEVRDGDPDREYPAFVDGARRCPPEDVGGPHGFMDFLEAVLDRAHEQHRDMIGWYGGPFDPISFDEARGPFLHGEHGAPAAQPAGQSQERIAASETMTAALGMAGRIDAALNLS